MEDLARFFTSWFANLNLSLASLQVDLWIIILIGITIAAFLVIAIIWGIRAHRHKVAAGREDMIGKTAEVKTFMNPKGTVLVQGELWAAILEDGQAKPGTEVVITKVDRLKAWVAKRYR